jgi:flagellar protein FliL
LRLILPIILSCLGLSGGIGLGLFLKPDPAHEEAEIQCAEPVEGHEIQASTVETLNDYIKLNNQFIIPIVKEEKVASLVVMSISLEVAPGQSELVYQREPKIRDALLRVMFDHANIGGFDGEFTENGTLNNLRIGLLEASKAVAGDSVIDVLIVDLARQDN